MTWRRRRDRETAGTPGDSLGPRAGPPGPRAGAARPARHRAGPLRHRRRRRRPPPLPRGARPAHRALPARRRRRVQLRQVELHQRAAGRARAARGRHPHHRSHQPAPPRARGDRAARRGVPARAHPSGRPPARDQRGGHARHQRHHPAARGADPRFPAARRPGPLRHQRRPPVHRERARLPGADPRVGQEDRLRGEQGRHPHPARGPAAGARLRARACAGAAGRGAPDLSRVGPRRDGRPHRPAPATAWACERLRRDGRVPGPHARPGGAHPAQAAQSAQRRPPARGQVQGRRVSSGSSCWRRTSRRSRASTASSGWCTTR